MAARSLLALLLLALCATAQAAPRTGSKPTTHSRPPILNTTLPVPEFTMPDRASRAAPPEDRERAATRVADAFPIHWRESREIADPDIISLIRNYRRDGLPVVPLWQSGPSRVAIGLNSHGLPGIYFTHHVGG